MMTQEHVQGGWNELKGEAKQQWGDLNDDELREFEGSVDEFIGMLQTKTGEAREQIEHWLREANDQYRPMLDEFSARAQAAAESAREGLEAARENFSAKQREAMDMVKRRPAESMGVVFGVGLIAGVVVGLLTSNRR